MHVRKDGQHETVINFISSSQMTFVLKKEQYKTEEKGDFMLSQVKSQGEFWFVWLPFSESSLVW